MTKQAYTFIVVPDTNSIRNPGAIDELINSEFSEFLDEYLSQYSLKLKIPEIVFGECAYQKVQKIIKAKESIAKNINTLDPIINDDLDLHLFDDAAAREIIENLLQKSLSKYPNTHVENIPDNKISIRRLAQDSVWRRPPFQEKSEKGFRDSIIIETLYHIAEENKHADVALISGDNMMRKAVEKRTSFLTNISVFETLGDYKAYLNTTTIYPPKIIHEIIGLADKYFCDPNNSGSLWYKDRIEDKLFMLGDMGTIAETVVGNWFARPTGSWDYALAGRLTFSPQRTTLKGVVKSDIFQWTTEVMASGFYQKQQIPGLLTQSSINDMAINSAAIGGSVADTMLSFMQYNHHFEVDWSSRVDKDKNFSNLTFKEARYITSSVSARNGYSESS